MAAEENTKEMVASFERRFRKTTGQQTEATARSKTNRKRRKRKKRADNDPTIRSVRALRKCLTCKVPLRGHECPYKEIDTVHLKRKWYEFGILQRTLLLEAAQSVEKIMLRGSYRAAVPYVSLLLSNVKQQRTLAGTQFCTQCMKTCPACCRSALEGRASLCDQCFFHDVCFQPRNMHLLSWKKRRKIAQSLLSRIDEISTWNLKSTVRRCAGVSHDCDQRDAQRRVTLARVLTQWLRNGNASDARGGSPGGGEDDDGDLDVLDLQTQLRKALVTEMSTCCRSLPEPRLRCTDGMSCNLAIGSAVEIFWRDASKKKEQTANGKHTAMVELARAVRLAASIDRFHTRSLFRTLGIVAMSSSSTTVYATAREAIRSHINETNDRDPLLKGYCGILCLLDAAELICEDAETSASPSSAHRLITIASGLDSLAEAIASLPSSGGHLFRLFFDALVRIREIVSTSSAIIAPTLSRPQSDRSDPSLALIKLLRCEENMQDCSRYDDDSRRRSACRHLIDVDPVSSRAFADLTSEWRKEPCMQKALRIADRIELAATPLRASLRRQHHRRVGRVEMCYEWEDLWTSLSYVVSTIDEDPAELWRSRQWWPRAFFDGGLLDLITSVLRVEEVPDSRIESYHDKLESCVLVVKRSFEYSREAQM